MTKTCNPRSCRTSRIWGAAHQHTIKLYSAFYVGSRWKI